MKRIAILGGGVGAITTAFELTEQPGWQQQYEITVYQIGWRLGGKGASGRNPACGNRIQEHGLHLWMGFYENAFDMMRRAYDYCHKNVLAPCSPFQSYEDAFSRMNFVVVPEYLNGQWKLWPMTWPDDPSDMPGREILPRDKPVSGNSPWHYAQAILRWLKVETESLAGEEPALNLVLDLMADTAIAVAERLDELAADAHLGTAPALLTHFRDTLIGLLLRLCDGNEALRRRLVVLDLGLAFLIGMFEDNVITRGFAAIEQYDFSEWLERHGCRNANCGLIISLYDSCFAYQAGDPQRRNMAAGSALYGSLRLMFSYRGALMWWMNAGMGDTVFSPLYLALKQRGVRFRFFHKVTGLEPTADGSAIGKICIDVQAKTKSGKDYDPLLWVEDLPCWPAEPNWEQLADGETIRADSYTNNNFESWWCDVPPVEQICLEAGCDFDVVVLGIAVGALPYIGAKVIASDKSGAWQKMIDRIEATRTQAFQLWLNKTPSQLGWTYARPVFCGYTEPFDTWTDMSHLIPRETYNPALNCVQIAYWCNSAPMDPNQKPFTDAGYPAEQLSIVRGNVIRWLERRSQLVWPAFSWNDLVNCAGSQGPPDIDSQFYRVNIDPTELYVLSVKGSTQYRLAPWDSKFENLVLAGDWTLVNLNVGCVEAAVESGRMACFAICGQPDFLYGAFRQPIPLNRSATA
jgi:uncharacterized protein with NAD-binding domain and iron-sulfur cluster